MTCRPKLQALRRAPANVRQETHPWLLKGRTARHRNPNLIGTYPIAVLCSARALIIPDGSDPE